MKQGPPSQQAQVGHRDVVGDNCVEDVDLTSQNPLRAVTNVCNFLGLTPDLLPEKTCSIWNLNSGKTVAEMGPLLVWGVTGLWGLAFLVERGVSAQTPDCERGQAAGSLAGASFNPRPFCTLYLP